MISPEIPPWVSVYVQTFLLGSFGVKVHTLITLERLYMNLIHNSYLL